MEQNAIRLLLIEDNPGDIRLFELNLTDNAIDHYDVQFANSLESAFEKLRQYTFDIVVSDLGLPDSIGLNTFRSIYAFIPFTPIIVLTGHYDNPEIGIEAVKEGAQDFLTKSELGEFGGARVLQRSIRYAIERSNIEAALRKAENALITAVVDAQEKERKRIAEDLHDGFGQIMSAIKLNLNSLIPEADDLPDEKKKTYSTLASLIDNGTHEIRSISRNLMPAFLMEDGLVEALRNLCDSTANSNTISLDFHSTVENLDLGGATNAGIYRIFQELINNILKHSSASRVYIQLVDHGNSIVLMVEDNGIGFDVAQQTQFNGLGLKNIVARVKSMNGAINIDSMPGNGTTITAEIPIKIEEYEKSEDFIG